MYKKIRHSKFKNTGILFELLARKITTDILNDQQNSPAAKLVREFFNGSTELGRELCLYQTLLKEKFSNKDKAKDLLSTVLDARKKLSNTKLRKEKYSLVKEINDKFSEDDFFSNRLDDYRVLASIYKLFEKTTTGNTLDPVDEVKSRHELIEHIIRRPQPHQQNQLLNEFKEQEKDIRLLAYKIMLERFNERYSVLDTHQKRLLREYITNISNVSGLREFVNQEINNVIGKLQSYIPKINDQVTKIKLVEVVKNIKILSKSKTVKDEQVVTLLRYYELLKELRKITN